MTNYQLYRTNILLGGQMKYDLILDANSNEVYIKSLYITPISNRVPYSVPIDENLLKYSHKDNISNFYKNTSKYFYKEFTNPVLTSLYPTIPEYNGEMHDSTYEMGCKRKNYDIYKRQFEFFCPLWIEQIDTIKDLVFEIQIFTDISQNEPKFTKKVRFEDEKFVKYFDDYIKHIKLKDGCDWVLDINEKCSIITGFNIKNSLCGEYKEQYLYDILTNRERPLLEFNNLITNKLKDRNLIARQLFNFNFCFNIEDILNPFVYNSLHKYPIYINIVTSIKGKQLEYRDIFSNHEYIEKRCLDAPHLYNKNGAIEVEKTSTGMNVLDYLKDYKCIDLIDKNKITQSTCHWNRIINPESIFNMYKGFAPIYKNKEQHFGCLPYYSDAITNLTLSSIQNNIYSYWCNNYKPDTKNYELKELEEFIELFLKPIINNDEKYTKLFTRFTSDCVVKNIHYKYNEEELEPVDVMILQIPSIDDNVVLDDALENVFEVKGINGETNDYNIAFNDISYIKITAFDNEGNSTVLDGDTEGNYDDCNIEFSDELVKSIHIKKIKEVVSNFLIDYSGWTYKEWLIEAKQGQNIINERILAIYSTNAENRKVIFLHENNENSEGLMLYKNFTDVLKLDENLNTPILIKDLYKILRTGKNEQVHIRFNSGLGVKPIHSPSLSSSEIKYYETFNEKNNILRNLGRIKPFFINDGDFYKNYQYYKKNITEVDSNFSLYANTIYPPKYPSIGYYAIGKKFEVYKLDNDRKELEFHNFLSNKIINLKPELVFDFTEEDAPTGDIQQYIKEQLGMIYSEMLPLENNEEYERKLDYIFDQYKITYTHIDSGIDNNSHKIIYKVQIKLK